METKICSCCQTALPRDAFNRCARRKDGLQSRCRNCQRLTFAEHYTANREYHLQRSTAYREAHPEETRRHRKSYYVKHRDYFLKYNREWQLAHPEQYRAQRQRAYQRHRVTHDQSTKAWAKANPEKRRQHNRKWEQANPIKRLEIWQRRRARKHGTRVDRIDYKAIWEHSGGTCYLCLLPVDRAVCHFDHVIPLSRHGTHTQDNIRVSHPACNLKKGSKLLSELIKE